MIEHTLITILTTLTLIQCFDKWGWIDYYSSVRKRWMPAGDCYLCLGFWLSIIVAVFYYFTPYKWLFIPFACAGIVNFIATYIKCAQSR